MTSADAADDEASRLDGRVVLITRAGSGIGRATALRAARAGAAIGAIDLDEKNLDAVVAEVRSLGRPAAARCADVSDAEALPVAVDELVGELGPLHAMFANAGTLTYRAAITDLDLA